MPSKNVTQKLIESHLISGQLKPGDDIALKIDQTLTQDATGTLVMLALESMNPDRVQTEVSVQYVDHNLVQSDNKNPDDHLFLRSACRRYGLWFSPPRIDDTRTGAGIALNFRGQPPLRTAGRGPVLSPARPSFLIDF